MWLIVGLGNPGPQYELTRHNYGFLAIDALINKYPASLKSGFQAMAARVEILGHSALLLKPMTFMNRSGQSVQQAMAFHKIGLDHVIVMHDELDLPLGELRIKQGGGNGGHNGLKDITRLVGADFLRIRLGIGRPQQKGSEADFVLSRFNNQEFMELELILAHALAAVETILSAGLAQAQQLSQIKAKN